MTRPSRKQPLSRHPLFRWVTASYFAALVGGGLLALLVVRNDLFLAWHDSHPLLAQMPIGYVGKLMVASVAALFGFLLGLVIAMRITALGEARDEAAEPVSAEVDDDSVWLPDVSEPEPAPVAELAEEEEEPRRPFNPREYLDEEEGIEAWEGAEDEPEAVLEEDKLVEDFAIEDYLPDAIAPDPVALVDIEDAEFEDAPVEDAAVEAVAMETAEPIPAPPAPAAAPATEPSAFGDLSLGELTARLAQALAAQREAQAAVAPEETDPVIAFLRREADRAAPLRSAAAPSDSDPQAVLRGALDRLSQVSNPR